MRGMQESYPRAYSEGANRAFAEKDAGDFDFSMQFFEDGKVKIFCEPRNVEKMVREHPNICKGGNAKFYSLDDPWMVAEMGVVARSVAEYNKAHKLPERSSGLSSWFLTDNGPEAITDDDLADLTNPNVRAAPEKESLIDRVLTYSSDSLKNSMTDKRKAELEANLTGKTGTNLEDSLKYIDTFKYREELGMSVSYFTRRNSKGKERLDMRYRQKKKAGTAGGFVKKGYVMEAVDALRKYDLLMLSNEEADLTLASKIAGKYFTEETQKRTTDRLKQTKIVKGIRELVSDKGDWKSLNLADRIADKYVTDDLVKNDLKRLINQHLEWEAAALSDDVLSGSVDRKTARQIYSRLLGSEKAEYVAKAKDIAKAAGYVQTVPVKRKVLPYSMMPKPLGLDQVRPPRRVAMGSGVYDSRNVVPTKVERLPHNMVSGTGSRNVRPSAIPPPIPADALLPRKIKKPGQRPAGVPPPIPPDAIAKSLKKERDGWLSSQYMTLPPPLGSAESARRAA